MLLSLISFLGGIAVFLYGMVSLSSILKDLSGEKLQQKFNALSDRKWKSFLLGAGATAAMQSSSATTVMTVGLVDAGAVTLIGAAYIIIGANVGTTVTAWFLSLVGIRSDNMFLQLLKPSSLASLAALVGIILFSFFKKGKHKPFGQLMLAFSLILYGLDGMSAAFAPLADNPRFVRMMTYFENPILGLIAGMILTAVIQSSSASIGILQTLAASGAVTFGSAVPIILGQNIGTCVTALLSSLGSGKNGKRAAFVHLYFNVISSGLILIVYYFLHVFFLREIETARVTPAEVAGLHTLLNMFGAFVLLPFSKQLAALAKLTVREKKTQVKTVE